MKMSKRIRGARYTSRIAARLACAVALALLVATPAASAPRPHEHGEQPPAENFHFFAETSVWNRSAPATAALDPNSRNVVASLLAQIRPSHVDFNDSGNLYIAGSHT